MVVPTGSPLLGINHPVAELTSRRPPRLLCPMLGSLQLGFNQLGLALSPWFKTGPLLVIKRAWLEIPCKLYKRCEWETPGNPL